MPWPALDLLQETLISLVDVVVDSVVATVIFKDYPHPPGFFQSLKGLKSFFVLLVNDILRFGKHYDILHFAMGS